MRVKGLNGQGGNKDMQLSAQAVIFPASVTVVKVADTERPTCSFEGKVAGNGGDTHTNEVTGTATDNEGNTATGKDKADIDIADVLPSIRVTKTAGLSTVHSGDSVTYTYAVHNLGIEPLSDVAVTDDKCSPVTQTGGDATDDELLDLTEVWTFTCTKGRRRTSPPARAKTTRATRPPARTPPQSASSTRRSSSTRWPL